MKTQLINEYGRDKLKIITKDDKKYIDAEFVNFIINKLSWIKGNLEEVQKKLKWKEEYDVAAARLLKGETDED